MEKIKRKLGISKIFEEENKYDPLAGFHAVHDLYAELVKQGCELKTLYDYSCKELMFILKYKREGLAFKLWRMGSMNRAAFGAKVYPAKLEEALPELFEKQQTQKAPMPNWLREDYEKKINKAVKPDNRFGLK
ncbi:MAG: hypothetical protein K2P14_03785 [Anaeroplasmataceae bacterium]|nr:hypothetical protein [Anaeroplasmataceae bacterium]